MKLIWHNGEFKAENTPVFTASDRIRLGDGVFDTMLVVVEKAQTPPGPPNQANAPRPASPALSPRQTSQPRAVPYARLIHVDLHFSRILHNANLLGIEVGTGMELEEFAGVEAMKNSGDKATKNHSIEAMKSAALETITRNKCAAGRYALNIIISRGPGGRGLLIPENAQPQIVMRLRPAPQSFPPVHAAIVHNVRRNEGSPLSQIKSCNYGDNILALQEAGQRSANEAIMLNNAGHVACASTANIFAAHGGRLLTPPLSDGALDGIVRRLLMARYDVTERSITPDDLQKAEGLYLTSSIRGVVPVVALDGVEIRAPSLDIPQYFYLG